MRIKRDIRKGQFCTRRGRILLGILSGGVLPSTKSPWPSPRWAAIDPAILCQCVQWTFSRNFEDCEGHTCTFGVKMFCTACGTECVSTVKFCHQCGHQGNVLNASKKTVSAVNTEELITECFHRRYPYNTIVGLLEKLDGLRMYLKTLKRKLKELRLKRKRGDYDEDSLWELIKQEMQGEGSLAGYRYIWHSLRLKYHLNVPRSLLASIMKEIDPKGVKETRSTRLKRRVYISDGPNFCWHIDSKRQMLYKILIKKP